MTGHLGRSDSTFWVFQGFPKDVVNPIAVRAGQLNPTYLLMLRTCRFFSLCNYAHGMIFETLGLHALCPSGIPQDAVNPKSPCRTVKLQFYLHKTSSSEHLIFVIMHMTGHSGCTLCVLWVFPKMLLTLALRGGQLNPNNIKLKGQSHEKVGDLRVWGGSLGPN
jgi:hypothetical protein